MALILITMTTYMSVIFMRRFWKGNDLRHALRIRQKWCSLATRILGIRVFVQGSWPEIPVMVESNHRSMMDPVVILSQFHCIPVGKAEIARYPLLGKAADVTGIIFLQRDNKNSRQQTRDAIVSWHRRSQSILIFPEGTTGGERTTREFKKGSFEVANQNNISVLPLVIVYQQGEVAWEDGSMGNHFMTTFGKRRINVNLIIGPVITPVDAVASMEQTKTWMDKILGNNGSMN